MNIMQRTGLIRQHGGKIAAVLNDKGLRGVFLSIAQRLKMGVQIRDAYILSAFYKDVKQGKLPPIAVEVKELIHPDEAEAEALARIGFHTNSRADVFRYLAEGQRCYVAKHEGQVASCFWVMRKEIFDYRLMRWIQLADDEEYILGGYTLPEFRGKGIIHHLFIETMRDRMEKHPNMRAVTFVDVRNASMLKTISRAGFTEIGHIGYIGVFGIRFTYILNRAALSQTRRRFSIAL